MVTYLKVLQNQVVRIRLIVLMTFLLMQLPIFAQSSWTYGNLKFTVISEIDAEVSVVGCTEEIKDLIIPSTVTNNGKTYSVTSIGDGAFFNCISLTSVNIPYGVTSIGYGAFTYCTGMTFLSLPNTITSIGESAFYSCRGLTSINIPNSIKSIDDYVFGRCFGLTSVEIPVGVTSIGDGAFIYCNKISSVNIPNTVTSIGESAFQRCDGLTSVTIPAYVTSIGKNAFLSARLKTIITESKIPAQLSGQAFELTKTTTLYVPEGCEQAYSEAEYWKDIPNIMVYQDGIENGCIIKDLRYVPYSNTNAYVEAFNPNITSATINSEIIIKGKKYTVDAIVDLAFFNCKKLTSVDIPNSITSIGFSAFYNCTSLSSVDIPNSISSIEYGTFNHCHSLSDVTIPDGVISIGNGAFFYCNSLISVTIPASVTFIDEFTFSNCLILETVYSMASTPPTICRSTFDHLSPCVLYVPEESVETYKAADFWNRFARIEGISSGVDGIADETSDSVTISNGTVTANADGTVVKIYTVNGVMVTGRVLSAGESINLSKGFYIIVADNHSIKAVVR